MSAKSTLLDKVKVIAGIEIVNLLIALVIPVTPSKTARPFHWPATWGEYFGEVLITFLLTNILLAVIFVVGWIFIRSGARSRAAGVRDVPRRNVSQSVRIEDSRQAASGPGVETRGLSPENEFRSHGAQFHGDH